MKVIKKSCTFKFEFPDFQFCEDEMGVTTRNYKTTINCKVTHEECIGEKECPIWKKN